MSQAVARQLSPAFLVGSMIAIVWGGAVALLVPGLMLLTVVDGIGGELGFWQSEHAPNAPLLAVGGTVSTAAVYVAGCLLARWVGRRRGGRTGPLIAVVVIAYPLLLVGGIGAVLALLTSFGV